MAESKKEELHRIHRVADQLVTMHATLRDEYQLKAVILDLVIMGSSLWLVAMVFVNSELAEA
ncbi:MAG: hypothetical protein GKR93_12575 [Gammaproteobacteria bacterium]|nr:hypothetical protein [Gammaproteobacteria bacterium]